MLHTELRFVEAGKYNCFHFKNSCYSLTPIRNYSEELPVPLPFKFLLRLGAYSQRGSEEAGKEISMSDLVIRLIQHMNTFIKNSHTGQKVLGIHTIKTSATYHHKIV